MNIFPAIDIINGSAVRLLKGDYSKKTVYSQSPSDVAKEFESCGASFLHVVDLDGAKSGDTPNFDIIKEIILNTNLQVEIGGGIRSEETVKKYIDAGVMRVILGTAAVQNPDFAKKMADTYGSKIAVGVDVLNGCAATKGWTEVTDVTLDDMFRRLESDGIKTVVCTDISKDGAMSGTNIQMYKTLMQSYSIDIVASGGVTTIDDVKELRSMGIYGAILGRALYEGTIDLKEAIEVAK